MQTILPRKNIEQLALKNRELVTLYIELIRLIERDIDQLKEGDTRSGWTSWAMIGGIVGALLLLFNETRVLNSFPIDDVKKIGLAGLLLYNIGLISMGAFSISTPETRPGRVRWSNEAFFTYVPKVVFRFLAFLTAVLVASSLSPWPGATMVISTFILWTLGTLAAIVYAKIRFPLGNTQVTRKGSYIGVLALLPFSVVALILLGRQLPVPVGEATTLPYILAGLIIAILVLLENLIALMAPSRLLSHLEDLRNDIIFLRVDIDQALHRYELLTEGETLPDALQKDLSDIADDLNLITYAHSNMSSLLRKMYKEVATLDDMLQGNEQQRHQIRLFYDSYSLHEAKCLEISNPLKKKLKRFNRKSSQVRAATEDSEAETNIRSILNQRLKSIEQEETQLRENLEQLKYYEANPGKMPEALRRSLADAESPVSAAVTKPSLEG